MLSLAAACVLAAGLLSCENALVSPTGAEQEALMVQTSVRSGGIIPPGESVQLSIPSPDEDLLLRRLEVEVRSADDTVIETLSIEDPLTVLPLPSIDFIGEDEGLYFLLVTLYGENEEILSEREIPVFMTEEQPVIERLETYPPSALKPESGGVIVPRVSMADNAWVRWTRDGKPLEEGPLSKYSEGFVWKAPEAEGVYSIGLEVYPFPPPEELGDSYSFSSSVSARVQFYVQEDAPLNPQELRPEDSYLHLLHLRGSAKNVGQAAAPFDIVGEAPPSVYGDLFGYRLKPGSSIEGNTSLLSYTAGGITPFSITLVAMFSRPESDESGGIDASRALVSVYDRRTVESDADAFLRLAVQRDGSPSFALAGLENPVYAQRIDMYELRELTLSFIPHTEGREYASGRRVDSATVKWYADGDLVHIETVAYSPEEPPGDALTVIGGKEGFRGIIDEFGLYYENGGGEFSADEEVFSRNALREYGADAVYIAEGYENGRSSSDGRSISPGSSDLLASFDEQWEELDVCIRSRGAVRDAELILTDERGELLAIPFKETYEGEKFCFTVYKEGNEISVSGTRDLSLIASSGRSISGTMDMSIRVTDSAREDILVQQLLVLRSATGLVGKN